MKISPWNCNHIQNTVLKPYEQGAQTCYIHEHNSGKNLLVLFFKDFLLGFLVHIVQLQYRELGLAERGVWLGSNWRSSVLAACKQPSFFMGAWPPLFDLPKQVGHNADTDMISSGSRDPSFSNHPTILASQVAWITGESQFSR